MAPCTHPGIKGLFFLKAKNGLTMMRLFALKAKDGLGRFALSALLHYEEAFFAL